MKREFLTRNITTTLTGQENDGARVISGFIPYNQRSENMGFFEYITPTAFNKTLADGSDVRALVNHNTDQLIGRVSNGSLKLESKEDGLYIECTLPDTQYARDAYELIKGGYNNGLSFGFSIINEDYAYEDGFEVHYLREVRLYEVSFAVSFPAYEGTNATVVRGIDLSNLSKTLGKEELSEDDIKEVKSTIEQLNKLLPQEEPEEKKDTTSADEKVTEVDDNEDLQFLQKALDEIKSILNE